MRMIPLLCLLLLPLSVLAQEEAQQVPLPDTPLQVKNGTAVYITHHSGMLHLVIGIKTPHADEEEQFLHDLQDRNSPTFHRYLTPQEWNERFAPSVQDEQKVADWLAAGGLKITKRYENRLIIDAEAPVEVVEKLFHVTINTYQVGYERDFSNDRDPTLPADIAAIVQSIAGLNDIQKMHSAHPGR